MKSLKGDPGSDRDNQWLSFTLTEPWSEFHENIGHDLRLCGKNDDVSGFSDIGIGTDDQRLEEFDHMIQGLPAVPALKYLTATHYRDADWLRVRPPLAALNAQTQEKLNKDFKKYIQSGEAR